MATAEDIIEQRDRFLALAFTTSDLLVEIDTENRISFAVGAMRQLTGFDEQGIKGRVWTDLFSQEDRPRLLDTVKNAQPGKRCGPLLVSLHDNAKKKSIGVLFSALRMPDKPQLYVTLALPNTQMRQLGAEKMKKEQEMALIDKDDFAKVAQNVARIAAASGKQVDMTMFELPNMQAVKRRLPPERWEKLREEMAKVLKSNSVDGGSAAQLSETKYGLMHDKSITSEFLQEQIASLLKEADPETKDVSVSATSIDAQVGALNEKEATRALMYTLNSFEKQGAAMKTANLQDSFKSFLSENAKKIQTFKQMIVHLDFYLQFQPIVSLETFDIEHYEILTRFRDGSTSPYEWITFGEEVGLARDFDMAVCMQAIRYITKLPPNPKNNRFALNISGQSIENDNFVSDLRREINVNKNLKHMLMFEITESANIKNLDKVNGFIGSLRQDGFEVCLDDFGAGSASYQYLQKLDVDFVKLDGAYVQSLFDSEKNEAMVRSLAQLCGNLKIGVVAEHIETVEEVLLLRSMSIGFGQGYYFSRPLQAPDYKPDPEKVARMKEAVATRR